MLLSSSQKMLTGDVQACLSSRVYPTTASGREQSEFLVEVTCRRFSLKFFQQPLAVQSHRNNLQGTPLNC